MLLELVNFVQECCFDVPADEHTCSFSRVSQNRSSTLPAFPPFCPPSFLYSNLTHSVLILCLILNTKETPNKQIKKDEKFYPGELSNDKNLLLQMTRHQFLTPTSAAPIEPIVLAPVELTNSSGVNWHIHSCAYPWTHTHTET